MAIPDKPLELSIDFPELTLGENAILFADEYDIEEFRQFLLGHVTSWSQKEINAIKRKELEEVRKQLFAKLQEQAVPLVKPAS